MVDGTVESVSVVVRHHRHFGLLVAVVVVAASMSDNVGVSP